MPLGEVDTQHSRRSAAERRMLTVLFADIVCSSAIVAGRDPEEADNTLQAVLGVMTAAVERYRGTVAQVLGDGVMAMFGAPSAMEDHALRACLAAQDMLAMATGPLAAGTGADVALRIGLASGEVLIQTVENAVRCDQRAVGECVHLAAKLQQRAEPNAILLSAQTAVLAGSALRVSRAGELRLARDGQPTEIFQLVGAEAGRRTALSLLSSSAGPLIGRGSELALLGSVWRDVRNGRGRAVLMTGEAGMGKSRLAGEFIRRAAEDGCAVVEWPQAPLRRLGQPDDLEAVASSLAALLANGAHGHALLAEVAGSTAGPLARQAVGELAGVRSVDAAAPGMDAEQRLAMAINGLSAAIVELARTRPIILLVEDVHWASAVIARLLDTVTVLLPGARVLLLATERPHQRSGWRPTSDVMRLPVDPLTSAETVSYLDHWLGEDPALTDLKETLASRSQGMPLYLEESLRALETAGTVAGLPGRYRLVEGARPVLLPPSVHGLIAARIDTLSEEARRTLMYAAVIGSAVDIGILRQLGPVADAVLPGMLDELEAQGFLERARVLPSPEYRFRHALFQEVAYGTFTRKERKGLHDRVFQALRQRRESDLPGRMELLAHHAFLAERWDAAYICGRAAGRRAEAQSRFETATALYGRALAALEHLEHRRRTLERRIDLSIATALTELPRGLRTSAGLLDTARELAETLGDRRRLARAMSLQCSFAWTWGDFDRARDLALSVLHLAKAVHDQAGLASANGRLSSLLVDYGRMDEALHAIQATVDATTSAPLGLGYSAALPRVVALSHKTLILAERLEREAAIACARDTLQLAEASGHVFTETMARSQAARMYYLLDDIASSVQHFERARLLSELTKSDLWRTIICAGLAGGLARLGNRNEATRLLGRTLGTLSRMPTSFVFRSHILFFAADGLLALGRMSDAMDAAEGAYEAARTLGQHDARLRAQAKIVDIQLAAEITHVNSRSTVQRIAGEAREHSFRAIERTCDRLLQRLTAVEQVA